MASETCTCGRAYTHCRRCGSRSVYTKKFRSMELSTTVYRCRVCAFESVLTEPCDAPPRDFPTDFTPSKPDNPSGLTPGSVEYARAMNEWVAEYSQKKGINVNKAFCEAKRQGWQPELYEMEDDLREALETAGLIPATAKPSAEQTESQDSGVTLDDIIKNLQEDSK